MLQDVFSGVYVVLQDDFTHRFYDAGCFFVVYFVLRDVFRCVFHAVLRFSTIFCRIS